MRILYHIFEGLFILNVFDGQFDEFISAQQLVANWLYYDSGFAGDVHKSLPL